MPLTIDERRADDAASHESDALQSRLWYAMKNTGVSIALAHRVITEDGVNCDRTTIANWIYGENPPSDEYHAVLEMLITGLNTVYEFGLLKSRRHKKTDNIRWLNSTNGYQKLNEALATAAKMKKTPSLD